MYTADVNVMLKQIIEEELKKYELNGQKIRFKSLFNRRLIMSVIMLPIGLLSLTTPLGYFVLIAYGIAMYNSTNLKYITGKAKKFPDREIAQIIREELAK